MTKRRTIIYIGGFELPDKNAAAHRVLNNGKILRDLGYNVVFIGIDYYLKADSNIIDTRNNIQGFDTWAIPYPKSFKDWPRYLSGIKHFEKILELYGDVWLTVAYNYPAVALNRLNKYCWNHDCKIIADCTEWYSTKGSNIFFKLIKGFDSLMRMRVLQKQLDGLIVISEYLEKYYQKKVENVIYLPPLVDKSEKKWEVSSNEKSSYGINFVYAGSLGRNKDHLGIIIKALAKTAETPQYSLNVIGLSKEEYLSKYPEHKKYLEELKENIVFQGRLTHIESLDYVKKADFSVFIRDYTRSTKAGFPTKYVESISCGTPVITTRSSDLQKYMTSIDYGFFLDIKNNNIDYNQLISSIGLHNIKSNKRLIDANTFDYRNYIDRTNEFINKIQSNKSDNSE